MTINSTAGNSAAFGGRRKSKKLRLVKKKTVRRMLKKMGLKMRGGAGADAVAMEPKAAEAVTKAAETVAPVGGRRHSRGRSHKRGPKRGRSLFGMRY